MAQDLSDSDSPMAPPSRYSAAQFLIALIVLICVSPLVDDFAQGDLVEAVLLTVVLLSAIPALGGNRRTFVIACLLALPAVIGKWIDHFRPDLIPAPLYLTTSILFAVFVVSHHLRFILTAPEVDTQVLCAGISTFLMLGLLWTFGYLLLDWMAPDSMTIQMGKEAANHLTGFNALYFSFATLSGLSYGEIVPVTNAARMLALLEAITSLFYFAVLISRLVALHTERAISKP